MKKYQNSNQCESFQIIKARFYFVEDAAGSEIDARGILENIMEKTTICLYKMLK